MDLASYRATYGRFPVERRDWDVDPEEFDRFAARGLEPLGAATLVWDGRRRILLVREAGGGRKEARWATPGGFAEPGESPESCAVREAGEEAGVDVRITGLTKVVVCRVTDGRRELLFTFFQFEGESSGGEPAPGPGVAEVAWLDDLPDDLHFRNDYVDVWQRGRSTATRSGRG